MKCSQCAHFHRLGPDGPTVCRRFPPTACVILLPQRQILTGEIVAQPQPITTWPAVEGGMLCGEFRPSKEIIV